MDAKSTIESGKAILGIEFGSTRIKAVLIDEVNRPIAQGSHEWENQIIDGLWTYSIEAIWFGVQDCYRDLRANVLDQYGVEILHLAAIGISAMMHGYMAFNDRQEILVPFRTWRNTNTKQAAAELSELFGYNIPQRWSISHLYQAILNNEEHVKDIDFLTTLAGYIHWQLTGEKALGIGDASGMIPVDPTTKDYSAEMIEKFNRLEQVGAFGSLDRDPGARVISVAYFALIKSDAGIDSRIGSYGAEWVGIKNLPTLHFDHTLMIEKALRYLRAKMTVKPLVFNLLPEYFTLAALQDLYEKIFGEPVDKRNFRRRILDNACVEQTDKIDKLSSRRGAALFHFNHDTYCRTNKFKI